MGAFSRKSNKPLANVGTRMATAPRSASVLSGSAGTRRPADHDKASAHNAIGGPRLIPPSRAQTEPDTPHFCTQRTPEHSRTHLQCDEPHPDILKIGEFRASSAVDSRERATGSLATVACDLRGMGRAGAEFGRGAVHFRVTGERRWARFLRNQGRRRRPFMLSSNSSTC